MLYGRDFCGEELKKDLNRVFEKHAKNANALRNSKERKIHHYSKSEIFDFRIASAVCQKNIGQTYMTDVNTATGLSPGKISHKFLSQLEKVKLEKKEKEFVRLILKKGAYS